MAAPTFTQVDLEDTLKVAAFLRRLKALGHLTAELDPLGRTRTGPWLGPVGDDYHRCDALLLSCVRGYPAAAPPDARAAFLARQLRLEGRPDPGRAFLLGGLMPGAPGRPWPLHEAFEALRRLYCGPLALEVHHTFQQEEADWMAARFEGRAPLGAERRRLVMRQLLAAEALERVLAAKYPSTKRFGLEGCEALLPGLLALVAAAAGEGVARIEMGMSHRGRLNVLANVLDKPFGALCAEMEGRQSDFHVGDVKYHTGASGSVRVTPPGGGPPRDVRLSIAPNPSHLEAVNPVVLGLVRAEQRALGARGVKEVMPLLVHGDAAFSALGAVPECLQLADLPGFSVGGTLHIVINNQIGFTTMPRYGRSCPHPTDPAAVIGAPVLHANADHPEAVVAAFEMAAEWRARFHRDVVVDLVGYRRNGHNELDDPTQTLPLSYARIATHPTVAQLYGDQLCEEGVVDEQELAEWRRVMQQELEEQWRAAALGGGFRESAAQFVSSSWQGDALAALARGDGSRAGAVRQEPTGLPLATLQRVGAAICSPPPGFAPHPAVAALLEARRRSIGGAESRVDWALAEALALGTLMLHRAQPSSGQSKPSLGAGLNYGHYAIRLTGQDVERGTFAQRHAVLWDQRHGSRSVLLNSVAPGAQEVMEVWNSPLSEAAVLGFEYGYSLAAKDSTLVMWEAQFGDFANNAQVIIDQFITSGEEKWGQQSGLVLLLPHGYDGQGPDHSSARIERFLQLVNDDPDHLPGSSPAQRALVTATFEAVARDTGGTLDKARVLHLLSTLPLGPDAASGAELAELLWGEMGLPEGQPLTRPHWEAFMVQYMRRNAESSANMYVVNATTPAQYFHALRRQVNLPRKKPLILFSPKYLLHHSRATSALQDFTLGTHFNRVIDDGKASDNTRHLSRHPTSGEPLLLPPAAIRRVVLCSGQVYYFLSRARRARRIRDIVLVRLEQVAPFPHDLVTRVVSQYTSAELVWAQEEPKNMGAWTYVAPRLATALRGVRPEGAGVRYVGRPPSASPATASFAIHAKQQADVVNEALSFPD